jgi:hypothetical protein
MIWLKILQAGAILAAGLLLVIFLEHTFISGPQRRKLARQARERKAAMQERMNKVSGEKNSEEK